VLRKRFDKSRDIDTANRLGIVERMRKLKVNGSGTLDEKFEVKWRMAKVSGRESTWINVHRSAVGTGEGRITMIVRSSLEEVASFFWDFTSRANLRLSGDKERIVEEERGGEWEMLTKKCEKLASKHRSVHLDREFNNAMQLVKIDEYTIIIQSKPKISGNEPSRGTARDTFWGVHKAEETMATKFKRRGEKRVEVNFCTAISLGKLVSKEATKATLMARLDLIMHTSFYFYDLLPSSEVTKEDGRATGEALMHVTRGQRKSKKGVVRDYVKSNKAFRELADRFEFIEPMMCAVVRNKLMSLANIKRKAEALGGEEGRLVGRSLAMSLATTLTPSAGVDEVRRNEDAPSP
jgi:hypothetical protein